MSDRLKNEKILPGETDGNPPRFDSETVPSLWSCYFLCVNTTVNMHLQCPTLQEMRRLDPSPLGCTRRVLKALKAQSEGKRQKLNSKNND
jgi:hypothetical protein